MRKPVVQAACIALPFVTAIAGFIITPGYSLTSHATTLSMATLIALGALFAVTLSMKPDPDAKAGLGIVAAWVIVSAIFIVTMMETVILRPGGVDGRHWMPSIALFAIAILCLCEREGRRIHSNMLLIAGSKAMIATGAILAISLIVSATASRLSGNNAITLLITFAFTPLIYWSFIQKARQQEPSRSRLGSAVILMLFMIIVTASGTYTWTPHYDSDAVSRTVFQ